MSFNFCINKIYLIIFITNVLFSTFNAFSPIIKTHKASGLTNSVSKITNNINKNRHQYEGLTKSARAKGYVIDQRGGKPEVVVQCTDDSCDSSAAGNNIDFNSNLAGGQVGNPGIKARINQRGFQYFTNILIPILNKQIKQARLPNLNECIPQLQGCINVYNIYISRYRCPQRIVLYPAPPNQIALSVENLDVGVTGNLGGQITILVPLALFGIIQVNIHQVTLRVSLILIRNSNGAPQFQLATCSASIGYTDVVIENGGLLGDIATTQFRGQISRLVRQKIQSKLCSYVPTLIDTQLNPKLLSIPQSIALTDILQIAINALGLSSIFTGAQCPSSCNNKKLVVAGAPSKISILRPQVPSSLINFNSMNKTIHKRTLLPSPNQQASISGYTRKNFDSMVSQVRARARALAPSTGHVAFVEPGQNPCANCPSTGNTNPLGSLSSIVQSLDMSKISNIYLTVQLLQSYATSSDFTVELNGEFSPDGQGGTPFGAFPMYFPSQYGDKMADILISDWTINSLLYHLHRTGFINIKIGPNTPKIGDLLKTTCSNGDDEEELEDHGVEIEAEPLLKRTKRQGDTGSTDLGLCLGDILPAVREKYPNQRVVIVIHSVGKAPSLILSSRNGGAAHISFILDADFFIESTNEKVGTIRIDSDIDVNLRGQGKHISAHADVGRLRLTDVGNSLGLPQDALDNIGNLGKEIVLKAGNEALEKGSSISIPNGAGGLPINIIDPEIHFVEHAILIQSDFSITSSALATLGGGTGDEC